MRSDLTVSLRTFGGDPIAVEDINLMRFEVEIGTMFESGMEACGLAASRTDKCAT